MRAAICPETARVDGHWSAYAIDPEGKVVSIKNRKKRGVMMAKGLGCLFVGAVLTIATEATAGFQNQYSDWEPLTDSQKYSYVAGFLDSFIDWRFPDGSVGQALGRGFESCLVHQKLTPYRLTQIVDTSYKQKVERHKFSPGIVLMCELEMLCSDDLKRELKAAGFNELEPCKNFD